MLSVILACDDPYRIALLFVERLGWRLVFATPPDSDEPLACVALGDAEVMLGTADDISAIHADTARRRRRQRVEPAGVRRAGVPRGDRRYRFLLAQAL